MINTSNTINESQTICNYAVLIKKMRLLRRLNRQQAALLFDFTFKYIEKIENGRGSISVEKFKLFQHKYGFSDNEIEMLRSGQLEASTDANSIRKRITTEKREDRRFCHRRISRECKVLKEMRIMKKLDQYSASKLCGYGKRVIGFIENGRISVTDKKIHHIVECYGFTMEFFNQLLKLSPLRHEMVEQSENLISKLDENKLRMILQFLLSLQ